MNDVTEKLAEALRYAIRQNEHDMMLVGDEIRELKKALTAYQSEKAMQELTDQAQELNMGYPTRKGGAVNDAMVWAACEAYENSPRTLSGTQDREASEIGMRAALEAAGCGANLPSVEWFSEQLCVLRNQWHEKHEESWLETDENHPDDFVAAQLREKLVRAIGDKN